MSRQDLTEAERIKYKAIAETFDVTFEEVCQIASGELYPDVEPQELPPGNA